MKRNLLYSCLLIIVLLFAKNVVITTAVAHNFSTDDNSTFLTLINMILIENRLINQSLNENSANTSLHSNYIENINEIIDDILVSEDDLLIDSDQCYNNTIIATMMANLADEVLRNYGHAYGIPSNIMLSMNFSNILGIENNSVILDPNIHRNHILDDNITSNMIDISSYQISKETSERMIEIYNKDLKGFSSDYDYIDNSIADLGDALFDLRKNIELKASPYNVMEALISNIDIKQIE